MRVTRREILKAIRTEKLQGGAFIQTRSDYPYIVDDTCKVCAIGAVLRQKGIPSESIENMAYAITSDDFAIGPDDCFASTNEFEAIKAKAYMNALSLRFEKLAKKSGTNKKTREALCRFVKRYFPKSIYINC